MTEAQEDRAGVAAEGHTLIEFPDVPGWSRIANAIVADPNLSERAKLAYIVLLDQARYHARRHNRGLNGAWIGCRQLARRAGMTVWFFREGVAELVAAGLVHPSTPAPGASVEFEVLDPTAEVRGGTRAPLRGGTRAPLRGGTRAPLRGGTRAPHDQELQEPCKKKAPDLLPQTLSFQFYLKKELRLHWSAAQMRHLEPAFKVGVRPSIVEALARDHILSDAPWDFCKRVLEAWERWRRIVAACVKLYVLHEPARTIDADRDWAKTHMTEEERQWFWAGGPADAIPASLRDALGAKIVAACDPEDGKTA